jgi:hypothetical protein
MYITWPMVSVKGSAFCIEKVRRCREAMRKKLVLSGLFLLCFSASAEWKFLFTTQIEPWRPGSKGMKVDHYIGEYSINAESPYIEIEVLQNFTTLESGTGPKRNWSVVKQEKLNCAQANFSTLSFVVFSDLNGLGEVLESSTQAQIKWKKIDSDEDITKIHKVVCSNAASR